MICVCHSQQLNDFNILSWRIAIGLGEHTLQIPLKWWVIAVPDGPTNGFGGARPCLDHDTHMIYWQYEANSLLVSRCVWKLGIPDLMAILVGKLMINILFVLTPCSEAKRFSMARWDYRNAGYPEFSQMLHFCRTHSTTETREVHMGTVQWINDPKQDQYGLVVHLWVKFPKEIGHSQLGHHSGVISYNF